MKGSLYALAYAAALGSLCALLLTGAGGFTAPYRKANARAEEMRSILGVLQVPYEPELTSDGLLQVFAGNVETEDRGGLKLYLYRQEGGCVKAVAVPFCGPGLWGPIEGFLALEPDMRTIRGIAFHRQEETPGLGGEIVAASFRRRFEGKSIVDGSGRPGIRILRGPSTRSVRQAHRSAPLSTSSGPPATLSSGPDGEPAEGRGDGAPGANEVDGISGATMTCEKVEAMLNEAIATLAKVRHADAR